MDPHTARVKVCPCSRTFQAFSRDETHITGRSGWLISSGLPGGLEAHDFETAKDSCDVSCSFRRVSCRRARGSACSFRRHHPASAIARSSRRLPGRVRGTVFRPHSGHGEDDPLGERSARSDSALHRLLARIFRDPAGNGAALRASGAADRSERLPNPTHGSRPARHSAWRCDRQRLVERRARGVRDWMPDRPKGDPPRRVDRRHPGGLAGFAGRSKTD